MSSNAGTDTFEKEARRLRRLIIKSLRTQGFQLKPSRQVPETPLSKGDIRALHRPAVEHRLEKVAQSLKRREDRLLSHIASGDEIEPANIRPRLIEVKAGTNEELLVRYAAAHWSIPVSSGYGRRLRFVVMDEQNGKLIGVIGLGDPVFALGPRDSWVGWNRNQRRLRIRHVMDAFLLGAVPPYSKLLGGKLVALLATSDEIQKAFRRKYRNQETWIGGDSQSGILAMLTTTSALGRSSIYNRLNFDGKSVFLSVGYTRGSGDFHFANGIYSDIQQFAMQWCKPTAKQTLWGTGFRNRRETVRKVLKAIGLPLNLQYHGVRREAFVVPLATNTQKFLRGENVRLRRFSRPADELFDYFRERWLLPRAGRDRSFEDFDKETYRLWEQGGKTLPR